MGLFSKVFGPSQFQSEVQKANDLQWFFIINNIREVEFSFGNSFVKENFTSSILIFDFSSGILSIEGDLVSEVFNYQVEFQIIKHQFIDGDLVFYLSMPTNNNIVMTCIVKRNYLLFEGTRSYWYAKLYSNRSSCIVEAKYLK
jgi:hypothetical protein